MGASTLGRRTCLPAFSLAAPCPCAGWAGRPEAPPRPLPWAPSSPAVGARLRLRWPSPRCSHDGGCSQAALSLGRAVGAVGAGRTWGPRQPGTNVSFCVSLVPSSSPARWAPRTLQEGLDDGPDFLSEEDRGVSSASFSLAGPSLPRRGPGVRCVEGSSVGRKAPFPRRPPFGFLASRAPPFCSPSFFGDAGF